MGTRETGSVHAAEFRWPDLGDRFNWAVDWFDAIAEGNDRALSVLTSGRAGLPGYHPAGTYHTLAIPVARGRGFRARFTSDKPSIDVRPATVGDLETVLAFLQRCGPSRQFFP
jgi:hypothetical protein